MEALAGRVPLDGDGAALGAAVAQHQLAVVVEPHLREQAQVGRHVCGGMMGCQRRTKAEVG